MPEVDDQSNHQILHTHQDGVERIGFVRFRQLGLKGLAKMVRRELIRQ
jgi:hypothetical protein